MMKEHEIKYDGSDAEMMRLGLIDEMGNVNNKRRNEFNQYMSTVWEKNHPHASESNAQYSEKSNLEEYFAERARKRAERSARWRALWNKVFCHAR
ncbi:MAG: hypothetical protein IJ866_01165 [Alphaproteobacteria bacterium]|nr:hypothetical protein [Alphaproteobacteria bacterium]